MCLCSAQDDMTMYVFLLFTPCYFMLQAKFSFLKWRTQFTDSRRKKSQNGTGVPANPPVQCANTLEKLIAFPPLVRHGQDAVESKHCPLSVSYTYAECDADGGRYGPNYFETTGFFTCAFYCYIIQLVVLDSFRCRRLTPKYPHRHNYADE